MENDQKIKVLVVEDSKTQALKLEYLLFRNGFEPMIASNGDEAIVLAKQNTPDLIISDIIMPKMSGYEFCLFLKSNQSTKDIPVILLTALSDTRDIIKGLECGASNFISKPYRDDYLITQIHKTLENRVLRSKIPESQGVHLKYEGKEYQITCDKANILDILVATYEIAIQKSEELLAAQYKLKNLNLELEEKVKEKTEHLTQEIKERQLAQAEIYRLSNVVHQAKSIIVLTDLEGNIEYTNPRFTEITGYALAEVIGKNPRILKSGKHDDDYYKNIWEQVLAGKEWKGEIINKKKNGELYYESASIFDIRDADATVRNLAKISEDITQRKLAEARINRLYNSLMDDIELASSVQSYLLPDWLVHENNISVTSVYTPSDKVGGDIFDIIPLTNSRYVVYIGDISGHGVQAALIMTAVKSTINMLVNMEKENARPYYVINKLNEILSKDFFQTNYLTIIFCMVDLAENTIRYLNAGHPALIEYNKITSETSIIDRSSSIPVGWLDSYQYKEDEEVTIPLSSDSVYFLYTDGLFECLNTEGLELGVSGFTRFLKDFEPQMDSILLPFIIKQKLIDEKYDLTGDDFTLLTLQKYDSDSKKDNLLLRYSIKDKQQVAEAVQNFIQEKYDNKEFYLIVNSIIANHIHNIINNLTAARIKYTILIQLVKSPDYLELTFWEKHDFAPVFDKITLTEADNYISDYNFNRYEITRNHYDDIIESIIKVPFK